MRTSGLQPPGAPVIGPAGQGLTESTEDGGHRFIISFSSCFLFFSFPFPNSSHHHCLRLLLALPLSPSFLPAFESLGSGKAWNLPSGQHPAGRQGSTCGVRPGSHLLPGGGLGGVGGSGRGGSEPVRLYVLPAPHSLQKSLLNPLHLLGRLGFILLYFILNSTSRQ